MNRNLHFSYRVGNTVILAPNTKCVILTPNNMLIKQDLLAQFQFNNSNLPTPIQCH